MNHAAHGAQLDLEIMRLTAERDCYRQALEQIAHWPAAGRAQELAKTALAFADEEPDYWDDVRKTARTFAP